MRGPWVARSYFRDEHRGSLHEGWLRTGDIATIDAEGCLRIVDRTTDLIKSGGEWISSVELEQALLDHPAVQEAAVVSVPHERWQERPLALVVLENDSSVGHRTCSTTCADECPRGGCPRTCWSWPSCRGPASARSTKSVSARPCRRRSPPPGPTRRCRAPQRPVRCLVPRTRRHP